MKILALIAWFMWLSFILLFRTALLCQTRSSAPWQVVWDRPNSTGLRHRCRQALHSENCSSPVWGVGPRNLGKSSCSVFDWRSGCLSSLLSAVANWQDGYVAVPDCHSSHPRRDKFTLLKLSCSQKGRHWAPLCPSVGHVKEEQEMQWNMLFKTHEL